MFHSPKASCKLPVFMAQHSFSCSECSEALNIPHLTHWHFMALHLEIGCLIYTIQILFIFVLPLIIRGSSDAVI